MILAAGICFHVEYWTPNVRLGQLYHVQITLNHPKQIPVVAKRD